MVVKLYKELKKIKFISIKIKILSNFDELGSEDVRLVLVEHSVFVRPNLTEQILNVQPTLAEQKKYSSACYDRTVQLNFLFWGSFF